MQHDPNGWIFFDADCQLCRRWIRRTQPLLSRRGFVFVPLQSEFAQSVFRAPGEQLLAEMRVLLGDGRSFSGADAIIELAKHVWWAWPFVSLAKIPGARWVLRAAYGQVAAHRHCGAQCRGIARNSLLAERKTSRRDGAMDRGAF